MAMRLWINGTELTNFILSTPFKDTLDEELDNLNFQIKSATRLTYKKFDKLMYWIGQGSTVILNKKMAIFNIVETWEGEKWTYQISCLSPTKILESIIINGMADTYASARLDLQLDRVRQKINAQLGFEMATPITISFDSSISISNDDLYHTASSDFLWDNQVNVREIFNDMLDKVDMICIGTDYTIDANGNITGITIGAVKREKNGSQILTSIYDVENGGLEDVKQVVKGITYNRDSEFACGNIISLIKNGIAKDNVLQPYTPARNTDLTIDDAKDWHIITQEPIYSVEQDLGCRVIALVGCYVACKYWAYENDAWVEKTDNFDNVRKMLPFDITDYIVEKSVFDAMSLSDQSKHIYFKRGEKGIYGLYNKYKSGLTGLFSDTAMLNIINDTASYSNRMTTLLNSYVNSNGVVDFSNYNYATLLQLVSNNASVYNRTVNGITLKLSTNGEKQIGAISSFYIDYLNFNPAVNEDAVKYALFSVNYQPYVDSVVKIEKTNIASLEANTKNLSVIKNQSDRTIDMSKYYDSQQALINRMGNKEMYIDAMVDLTADYSLQTTLWGLGDYMTLNSVKWTITQREFENYNENKLKVRYTLSKDYNASNVDIQLKRDKRLYGIPLTQFVDRYIIIKGGQYMDSNTKKILLECWDDFTGSTTTQGYCLLEAVKIGNANILHKVARAMDNYAVDIERTKYSSTIVNVYLRYCDTDGFKENITLYGLSNVAYSMLNISDYSRLPFIPNSDVGQALVYGWQKVLTGIKKDKMERLIFIYRQS